MAEANLYLNFRLPLPPLTLLYSPVPGRSVPFCRSTWYSSADSRSFHTCAPAGRQAQQWVQRRTEGATRATCIKVRRGHI